MGAAPSAANICRRGELVNLPVGQHQRSAIDGDPLAVVAIYARPMQFRREREYEARTKGQRLVRLLVAGDIAERRLC